MGYIVITPQTSKKSNLPFSCCFKLLVTVESALFATLMKHQLVPMKILFIADMEKVYFRPQANFQG